MHKFMRLAAVCGVAFIVGACSQPEPEPVRVAPTYDKLGNATCPTGMVLAVDADSGAEFCADAASI